MFVTQQIGPDFILRMRNGKVYLSALSR
ncbi:uncharacterized, partial [Tachysurus ichikawai]